MNANEQNIQAAGQGQPKQPATQAAEPEIPTFRRTIGGTTYIVRVHFSETSKETLADKVKRLMVEEVKNNDKQWGDKLRTPSLEESRERNSPGQTHSS